jgi:hypothetical protein
VASWVPIRHRDGGPSGDAGRPGRATGKTPCRRDSGSTATCDVAPPPPRSTRSRSTSNCSAPRKSASGEGEPGQPTLAPWQPQRQRAWLSCRRLGPPSRPSRSQNG